MAFFYGLVSQRGPFKETEIDYLRLTDPQFQLQVDPNTTNDVNTAKLRMQQRTSGRIGSQGDDRKYKMTTPINGIENTLGLNQEIVNAIVDKASSPGFTAGEGDMVTTEVVANMLPALRKSTLYNYALGPVEDALRKRFEKTKNTMRDEDFFRLNWAINGIKYDTRSAASVTADSIKLREYQKTMPIEAAKAKVLTESQSREQTQKWLDGHYTIPSPEQQLAMSQAGIQTKSEPMPQTPQAPQTPQLGLEGVQLNETIQEPIASSDVPMPQAPVVHPKTSRKPKTKESRRPKRPASTASEASRHNVRDQTMKK